MHALVSLLRRRPHFRRLWLSEIVSLLGDWMSFVAISLLALREGGSVVALALVLAAHNLPHAVLAPIAGTLADRLDRRRLMISVNVIEGALTIAMALAASRGEVALVQVLVLARASAAAFLPPVQSATLRRVVEGDELLAANTVSSVTWSVMFAVGMGVGGAIAALGPTTALLLDATSFGVAALLLRGLPPMVAEGHEERGRAGAALMTALTSVRRDMLAAFRHARSHGALLEAMFGKTPLALAAGGAWVLLNLTSNHASVKIAGSAALALGLLQCVRGVGTGVGPMLSARLLRRGMSIKRAVLLSALTAFGGIALFALVGTWPVLLISVLAWGAGIGSNWVITSAEIQRLSPDRFVGRLSAIDGFSHTVSMSASALAGAALVDATGAETGAAWLGIAAGIAGFLVVHFAISAKEAPAIEPPAALDIKTKGAP
jgi:MFS family permease